MIILKAEITGFGKYHEQQFHFDRHNQLLFGQNEMGKSTLYQFIAAMLFGFPKKTAKKKDYTPRNGAAYGGKLWIEIEPYGEVIVERYRQVDRGRAKVHVNGQITNEDWLATHIQPLNQALFADVFTFQQEQLNQIDKLGEEALHQSLISLGISGSQNMLQQVARFESDNQQVYKPRGQKLPLNQALKQLGKLQQQIADKESEEAHLQQQYQKIAQIQSDIGSLQARNQSLNEAYQENQQRISHWALYEEWQQIPDRPVADPQQAQAIKTFYQTYQQLTEELRKKEAELDQLEQGQASDKYFFYLDHEQPINHLLQQQVEIVRISDRQTAAEAKRAQAIQQLNQLVTKRQWRSESPPFLTPPIREALQRLDHLKVRDNEIKRRQQWLAEKAQPLEATVSRLEQQHPTLAGGQKKRNGSWLLPAAGLVLVILGFVLGFLLGPWRWAVSGVGLIVIIGSFILNQKSSTNPQQVKEEWQAALLQLDLIEEEQAELQEEAQQQQQSIDRKQQGLLPFFGQLPSEEWADYLDAYEADVAAYQHYLQEEAEASQAAQAASAALAPFEALFQPYLDWLPLHNKAITDKLAILADFAKEMQTIKLSRLQQPSTLLAQQLARLRKERADMVIGAKELLQQQGLDQPAEISLWLKQWESAQRTQQRAAELQAMLTPIFPEKVDEATLRQEKDRLRASQAQVQEAIRVQTEDRQKLELEVAASQKNGTLNQLYQEESELRAAIQDLAVAWGSRQLAAAILRDITTELSEQQLPQLLNAASTYFAQLTNGHYQQILFEQGMLIVANQSETFSIIDLSTGTKDQLIMAIRFGYLSLQKEQPISPLIIDDGWLHYDSVRKESLVRLLADFGERYQVICLSSDQEMVSYYQKYQQPVYDLSKGCENLVDRQIVE
ncbi:hypothetical protein A5886_000208 [Enterococcus sp. 8G7_MSG3316]|uniref:YhaN AAA domain-containing protein n=1 Tax=Candidatus Enterococcus testudinis TaxID=1834191 RepID=A0A242A273_9ENTE|nr:AAA family ATPase [Enterococcus sp. 8G7_MSG3316]OTN75138.1 hypothetical protein A5886_000208 [Enterococcus sp. 8G7_MSG3316]